MKRSAIPDPVIVSLAKDQESLPHVPSIAAPVDSRQTQVGEFIQARSLQPSSKQAYRRDLQYFMDWTDQTWDRVTARQVAQFKQFLLQQQQLSPSSVNRILRTLKSFYKWLLRLQYVSLDPTTDIKQEQVPQPQSQELEDAEVDRIFTAIREVSRDPVRDRALFSLLLHGLRAEEAISLNLEDYDGQQVIIRSATQNGTSKVSLMQQARADLDALVHQRQATAGQELAPQSPLFVSNSNRSKGQRLTYWGVQEVMNQLAKQTGIALHAHRGRHTFCANLIGKLEMDTTTAMALSRHRDARSLKRYTSRKK